MTTKHSKAPWSVDTVRNEGEYGSGPNTGAGFDSYAVFDAAGRILFDSLNSDAAEVHAVEHEVGVDAWDDVARENLTIAAAAPELLAAAVAFMEGEGNCKEVRDMFRAAIAKARGES